MGHVWPMLSSHALALFTNLIYFGHCPGILHSINVLMELRQCHMNVSYRDFVVKIHWLTILLSHHFQLLCHSWSAAASYRLCTHYSQDAYVTLWCENKRHSLEINWIGCSNTEIYLEHKHEHNLVVQFFLLGKLTSYFRLENLCNYYYYTCIC